MLARGVRNVIYNYTDAQRKVRSATSNDAWGPSPALMHEISDLTDNVVAYAEIMPIVWKRLNDHGKNWRHVYKSLVLLDHLIKYGNERVSQQCKENIFAIQTLKDFQYVEDQKDQGYNVREKAKQLVALLKDDERLRNERRKAHEARERYSRQAMGMDSTGAVTYGRTTSATSVRRNSAEGGDGLAGASYLSNNNASNAFPTNRSSSFNDNLHAVGGKDFVRPLNPEEEQLQMQIALAESQRDAEDEERRRRNDELKLKIALERSVNEVSPDMNSAQPFDFNSNSHPHDPYLPPTTTSSSMGWNAHNARPSTHLGFTAASNDPWSTETNGRNSATTTGIDPWQSSSAAQVNPWNETNHGAASNGTGLSVNVADPWGAGTNGTRTGKPSVDNELSEFFGASATNSTPHDHQQPPASNPWDMPSSTIPSNASIPHTSGSISPSNNGHLLYPTTAGGTNSNSDSTSPFSAATSASRKTPESFLGDKFSTLVDLDKLITQPKSNTNPFGSTTAPRAQNPFANTTKPPTLDQLSSSTNVGFTSTSTLPPPLIPSSYNNNQATASAFSTNNPFM